MKRDDLRIKVEIDGGARGNPGPAGGGVVVRDAADGTILHEAGIFLGRATNNVAEYRSLLYALKAAGDLAAAEVDVLSDSQLLVRQMNGEYQVKNAGLKPLFEKAQMLAGRFRRVSIRHVRREENLHADRLANQAINLKQDVQDAARNRPV